MSEVTGTARKATQSDAVHWGARLGFAARATIYLLMGLLALALALGRSSSETDQRGALRQVAEQSGGTVLLVALAVGFAGYALWRLGEAAFGVTGEGKDKGPRVKALVSGLVYGSLAVTTVTILLGGSGGSQAQQSSSLTARAMQQTGGRWVVGLVGLVIAGAGAVMVYEGWQKKFLKHLRTGQMSPAERDVVGRLGMVGTIARGVVIALSGVLVVQAAVTFDPDKARGLDGALRTLASQPFGPYLLGAAALGLMAFGVYGYAEARWRRT